MTRQAVAIIYCCLRFLQHIEPVENAFHSHKPWPVFTLKYAQTLIFIYFKLRREAKHKKNVAVSDCTVSLALLSMRYLQKMFFDF